MKRLLISGSAGLIILFALMFNVATVSHGIIQHQMHPMSIQKVR
jgi:hypothetical protein